jgi:hypothetical protein
MAAKKKTTKKAKKTPHKKLTPTKAKKSSKKLTKKKPAPKRAEKKRVAVKEQPPKKKSKSVDELAFSPARRASRSGEQSGDLQGLSSREGADSESVDELLEEGNAFEADVVAGVERADNNDEQEVRTHEVPEDDVPGEYLDED